MANIRERAANLLANRAIRESQAADADRAALVGRDPDKLGDVVRSMPTALSSIDHSVNSLVFYAASRLVAPKDIRREMPPVRRLLFPKPRAART